MRIRSSPFLSKVGFLAYWSNRIDTVTSGYPLLHSLITEPRDISNTPTKQPTPKTIAAV